MISLKHRLAPAFAITFGRCETCMRIAFRSAVCAWALTAGLSLAAPGPLAVALAACLAGLLTTNALLHLIAYAVRQTRGASGIARAVPPVIGGRRAVPALASRSARFPRAPLSRRDLIRVFVASAASAAAAMLALPRGARAACGDCAAQNGAGWYDCITNFCNNVGQACCPPGYPYLNHCDCQCYDGTSFDCGSYSGCQYCG